LAYVDIVLKLLNFINNYNFTFELRIY